MILMNMRHKRMEEVAIISKSIQVCEFLADDMGLENSSNDCIYNINKTNISLLNYHQPCDI